MSAPVTVFVCTTCKRPLNAGLLAVARPHPTPLPTGERGLALGAINPSAPPPRWGEGRDEGATRVGKYVARRAICLLYTSDAADE